MNTQKEPEEFWHVSFEFKDGSKSEHFCLADEYDDDIAILADKNDAGLKKITIEVVANDWIAEEYD